MSDCKHALLRHRCRRGVGASRATATPEATATGEIFDRCSRVAAAIMFEFTRLCNRSLLRIALLYWAAGGNIPEAFLRTPCHHRFNGRDGHGSIDPAFPSRHVCTCTTPPLPSLRTIVSAALNWMEIARYRIVSKSSWTCRRLAMPLDTTAAPSLLAWTASFMWRLATMRHL